MCRRSCGIGGAGEWRHGWKMRASRAKFSPMPCVEQTGRRGRGVLFAALLGGTLWLGAAQPLALTPETRLDPEAKEWRELVTKFAQRGDIIASFEERRVFPFRSD